MIIGICDDQKVYRNYIRKICDQTVKQFTDIWEIVEFVNGTDLLRSPLSIDILILDLEMPYLDGIQVKEALQSKEKETIIIYVTSHLEMMQKAFGLHVLGFVQKADMDYQLPVILRQALCMQQNCILVNGKYNSKEILYLKSEHIYCQLYLTNGGMELVRISLKELEEMLNPMGFVKTQRSYLVNLKWVETINNTAVVMKGNHGELPLSRRNVKIVKESYMKYCKEHGRYC